jgi:DNA polymerase-4
MINGERTILHLDLNTFFVSVERLREPQAERQARADRRRQRPRRGGISCSYEARAFGVRSAMPMKMAKQLCPEAIILRGDSGAYLKKSDEVTEIIRAQVPLFEKSSVDEFYVDLSGTDKFHGSRKLAAELRQKHHQG